MQLYQTNAIAFVVWVAGQVYCGDAAQRLGPLAQDWCVGAGTGYQPNFKPDFRKRVLRAHRPEGISSRKGYLELAAARFQTGKELGRTGRDRITRAFHHHGVSRQ